MKVRLDGAATLGTTVSGSSDLVQLSEGANMQRAVIEGIVQFNSQIWLGTGRTEPANDPAWNGAILWDAATPKRGTADRTRGLFYGIFPELKGEIEPEEVERALEDGQ